MTTSQARIHLNVKTDGTTYIEHDTEAGTLTPYCRKCPDWQGETVTYEAPDSSPGQMALRMALLHTNKSTVWHAVEHGGAIPRPAIA